MRINNVFDCSALREVCIGGRCLIERDDSGVEVLGNLQTTTIDRIHELTVKQKTKVNKY